MRPYRPVPSVAFPIPVILMSLTAASCMVDTTPMDGGYYYEEPHISRVPTGAPPVSSVGGSGVCSAAAEIGSCNGDQLSYCEGGQNYVDDCGAAGNTCGYSASKGWYECQYPVSNAPAPVDSGCGAVTNTGTCDGQDLLYCEDGELKGAHCGEKGTVCGFDQKLGWYDCMEAPTRKPPVDTTPPASGCGTVDMVGECDGDTVVWCEGTTLQTLDCASAGRTCGWNDAQKFNDCVDGPILSSDCGDIDNVGVCTGASLAYCQDDALVTQDCAFGCGWNATAGYNDCLAEPVLPVDPCSGIDEAGLCTDGTLTYCQDGTLLIEECLFGCGLNVDAGWSECLPEPVIPVDPCAGIDAAGVCDGDTLAYCAEDTLVTEACLFGCGWNADAGLSECLPEPVIPVDPCAGIDAAGVCDGNTLAYCAIDTLVTETCLFGCGWNADAGLSECLPEPVVPVDPCAGIDESGTCDGDTLVYCQVGALQYESCAAGCGFNTAGYFECLPEEAPASACGDIDAVGLCDGATLWYCEDATLYSQECQVSCGWDEMSGYYSCL